MYSFNSKKRTFYVDTEELEIKEVESLREFFDTVAGNFMDREDFDCYIVEKDAYSDMFTLFLKADGVPVMSLCDYEIEEDAEEARYQMIWNAYHGRIEEGIRGIGFEIDPPFPWPTRKTAEQSLRRYLERIEEEEEESQNQENEDFD